MAMRIVDGVYVADTARILGAVELGPDVNVWYGVSIRGDIAPITVGPRTNVQDNTVIHCDVDRPNAIGADVTIGHGAIVHGDSVGDQTLIGMGAVVLARTRIGRHCMIAAGSVVSPGMDVPDGMVVMGVPGRIVRPVTDEERDAIRAGAAEYVKTARLHAERPDDPRVRPFGADVAS